MALDDKQRAAIIVFLQSLFPVLVILGLEVDSVAQAAIMLCINNGLTLWMLLWKPKAVAGVASGAPPPLH